MKVGARDRLKTTYCCCLVTKLCPTLLHWLQPTRLLWWARILEWVVISLSRGSSWPRDQTQVSCIAGGFFFTTEPQGRPPPTPCSVLIVAESLSRVTPRTATCQAPLSMEFPSKHTGVGCHFLLQGIFLIQGLNLCLLYCRQILYHWATGEA